jgi:hypothetical protein
MSSKLAIDLNEAARDLLRAKRPAEVPAAVEYRAEQDSDPIERPYFVLLTEGLRVRGGVLWDGELVLRMRVLSDDTTATAAAGWHQASARLLRDEFAALRSAMQAKGYVFRFFRAGEYEDAADGKDGRRYEQRWKVQLCTALP